jgi:hypothetical protein
LDAVADSDNEAIGFTRNNQVDRLVKLGSGKGQNIVHERFATCQVDFVVRGDVPGNGCNVRIEIGRKAKGLIVKTVNSPGTRTGFVIATNLRKVETIAKVGTDCGWSAAKTFSASRSVCVKNSMIREENHV